MLAKLKVLLRLAGTSQDVLLQQLLDNCEAEFLELTHRATLPTAAENVVLRMAMVRYNLLTAEGLSSQSFNGISEGFSDYDGNLLQAIYHFRKAVML